MARRRMVDPNIWQSEDFAKLSTLAKLVFIGLFSNADDEGRGRAKPVYIKSILFPYDDGMRVIDIEKALSEIGQNVSVTLYDHDGNEYYSLDNWSSWQKVEKPSESKIPPPPDGFPGKYNILRTVGEQSANGRGTVAEQSRLREEKGIEENIPPYNPPKPTSHQRGDHGYVKLTDAEYAKLVSDLGEAEAARVIAYVDESAASTENKNEWRNWNLVLRKASREGWGKRDAKPAKSARAQNHATRKYTEDEIGRIGVDLLEEL